jgi:hypothetical protein
MKVVGTGLPRTGTNSLKVALERLLGEPCYHMYECVPRMEEHGPIWTAIAGGAEPEWSFLDGFGAIVDWPGSAMWDQLVAGFPDAIVVHSVRDDAEQWWRSVDATVGQAMRGHLASGDPGVGPTFIRAMVERAGWGTVEDGATMQALYHEHDRRVREVVEADRLVVVNPSDGWGPLCAALGVEVPDEPYPSTNSTAEFQATLEAARDRRPE